MPNEIKRTWFFDQSPQEVWEVLTKPELIEQWLGKTDFQPTVGHKFRFISPYGNDSICEVLEVTPFAKLVYSWQKNSAKDNQPFTSKVTWTLVAKENGTELQLVHHGFRALEDIIPHENGWNACLNQFEGLLRAAGLNKRDYTVTITVSKTSEEVFNHITSVSQWWSKDFEGSSTQLHDEFVIAHTDRHFSKQKLIEVSPGRKLVWLVTDSTLNWLEKDKHEWTNTKMIFEITTNGDQTVLHFTHEGLVPEKECYARCEQGWNMVIKERLFHLITEGKGI